MEGTWGKEGIAPLFLNLGTGKGWVVSITPWPHFTPKERTPSTHCTEGWVGPRASWAQRVEEKSSGSDGDQNLVAQAVASHYTDWATWLTNSTMLLENQECGIGMQILEVQRQTSVNNMLISRSCDKFDGRVDDVYKEMFCRSCQVSW
jgi:hypothetical protein